MAKLSSLWFYHACLMMLLGSMSIQCGATDEDRKVYIVYLGSLPEGDYSHSPHHLSILQEFVKGSSMDDVLVRSYKRSFNGFAAKLTDEEQKRISCESSRNLDY